ncbi:MAG: HD domain-containing protein [Clostridia bacterium]|nr:HD domain-containing protein [Clostridia bacterium]
MPCAVAKAIARLESAGFEAFAVGGCVRDSMLGRTPNDWDITTSARPEQTAALFSDCRTVETGIKHGTLTVIMDGMPLEITTFRNDGEYADNRHPVKVTFSTRVEDDLSRRDFTVNAMAYRDGRGLVDLFDGIGDLTRRRIACVGDPETRFREDGLRILRAIRFASVLDFEIAPETTDAIHACRALLQNIAAERIREEFCKLICGVGAVRILREYHDVIAEFIPELEACVGFAQNTKYHHLDVFAHSLAALSYCKTDDLVTRLSILLHDVGKPLTYTEDENGGHFSGHAAAGVELTERILRRLRFDNATQSAVTVLVERHDIPIVAEERAVKRLMRRMSEENILRLMEIKRCDRLAHAPEYSVPPPELERIPVMVRELLAADACLSLKTLRIKGDDLIALGVPAGKEIGRLLTELLDAVIEGDLENERDTLLQEAKKRIKK